MAIAPTCAPSCAPALAPKTRLTNSQRRRATKATFEELGARVLRSVILSEELRLLPLLGPLPTPALLALASNHGRTPALPYRAKSCEPPVMPKAKRNPVLSLLQAIAFLPPIAFALYFGALRLAASEWLAVPPAIANWTCLVCSAITIYGSIAIFLVLAVIALASVYVAIAAATSWLDRYGMLEDIITYVSLVALVPLSLGVAYLLFEFPAAWWRAWVRSVLCNSCQ